MDSIKDFYSFRIGSNPIESTMDKNLSRWAKSGNKCKSCYTTKYIYYCFTDIEGNTWESCKNCLDKVRKMRDDKIL